MNDQLGKLIEASAERDAIHIAIAPVVANESLVPGSRIGFIDGSTERVSTRTTQVLGVVDPFLTNTVKRGQRFYMLLLPNTITSLKHVWAHPAFDVEPVEEVPPAVATIRAERVENSREWLKKFANEWDLDYERMIADTISGDGVMIHGTSNIYDIDKREFLAHVERVTGEVFDRDHREDFSFSCEC